MAIRAEVRNGYDQGAFCLPRQDLTQVRYTKLYNAIPHFAPSMTRNSTAADLMVGGCFRPFDILEFV